MVWYVIALGGFCLEVPYCDLTVFSTNLLFPSRCKTSKDLPRRLRLPIGRAGSGPSTEARC